LESSFLFNPINAWMLTESDSRGLVWQLDRKAFERGMVNETKPTAVKLRQVLGHSPHLRASNIERSAG
jgi:hypothetical protein